MGAQLSPQKIKESPESKNGQGSRNPWWEGSPGHWPGGNAEWVGGKWPQRQMRLEFPGHEEGQRSRVLGPEQCDIPDGPTA